MKKLVKILLIFSLILGVATNAKFVSATSKYNSTVNTKIVNVREKASSHAKKVGTLKKGTKITVYSKSKTGWSQIKYKSKKAYVPTKDLKFTKDKKKTSYLSDKSKVYYYRQDGGTWYEKYSGKSFNGYSLWYGYYGGQKNPGFIVKEDSTGLYRNELTLSKKLTKWYPVLKYPIKVGNSWSYKMNGLTWSYKITAINKTIKTKAGTFKNVVEVTDINGIKDYYAPNVGLIKVHADESTGWATELDKIKKR